MVRYDCENIHRDWMVCVLIDILPISEQNLWKKNSARKLGRFLVIFFYCNLNFWLAVDQSAALMKSSWIDLFPSMWICLHWVGFMCKKSQHKAKRPSLAQQKGIVVWYVNLWYWCISRNIHYTSLILILIWLWWI